MKIKVMVIIVLLFTLAALIIIILPGFGALKPFDQNLMNSTITWDFSLEKSEIFEKLLLDKKHRDLFKRDLLNFFYPNHTWAGRLRHAGVSYHGLFTLNNSTITIKPESWHENVNELELKVFNGPDSRLLYRVGIRSDLTKKWSKPIQYLYNGSLSGEVLQPIRIPLPESLDGSLEIVLETKGSGIGAWINPRLLITTPKPRIFVIILLDALRSDHLSLYGYRRQTSPVLDSLQKQAVVFRNAYSTTSWTLPAMVSLFSGKDIDQHGVMNPRDSIPDSIPMLAEVFQCNGFQTAAFTGGGFVDDRYGFARGFNIYSNNPGMIFNMNSAELLLDDFTDFMNKNTASDIFIFLHTYQIHAPYKAPRQFINQVNPDLDVNFIGIRHYLRDPSEYFKNILDSERQNLIDLYDSSILYSDRILVGGVADYLRQNGLFDDAMLVIMSDHGQEFYDHHSWEHGHSLYRELLHIPLLIKYPANRLTGEENRLVSISDIANLVLQESAVSYDRKLFPPPLRDKDRTLSALLPVSPIIPQFPGKIALLSNQYHFIINNWKNEQVVFFDPRPPLIQNIELYHARDIKQLTNLADRRPHVVNDFKSRSEVLLRYLDRVEIDESLDKDLEKKLKSLGYLGGGQ